MYERVRNLYEREEKGITLDTDESSWEFHYRNLLNSMHGTLQEKQDVIRKRILRYFGEFKLKQQNYFCLRNDPDIANPYCSIIPNQIMLYGADYFSIKRAQQYFNGFFVEIKRIDDSHLLIQFQNQKECFAALNKNNSEEKMFKSPTDLLAHSQNGWIMMRGYKQFIFDRQLMGRYVTNLDKFEQNKYLTSKNGLYFAYSEAKKKFLKDLQQNDQKMRKSNYLFSNMNRNNNRRERLSSRSRSRSKQHQNYGSIQSYCCKCQPSSVNKNGNNFVNRNRDDDDIINSSKRKFRDNSTDSRRSNYSLDRNSRKPAILQQMRTQEMQNKFEEYLKKREKYGKKTSPTTSTAQKVELQLDMPSSQNHNDTLMQFEQVLQRMRLDDSQHQYSAFLIDQEDDKQ